MDGNGNTVTGMGMAYFSITGHARCGEEKNLVIVYQRELTAFLTQQHAVTDEREN